MKKKIWNTSGGKEKKKKGLKIHLAQLESRRTVLVQFLNTARVPGQSGLFVQRSWDFPSKKWFLHLSSWEIRNQMSNNKGSLVWHSSPVCFGSLSAFSLLAHWSLFIDIFITIITNYWNETCITDFPLPSSALQIHINWVRTTQGTLLISALHSFYYYELETKLSKIKQNPWGPAVFLRQNLWYFAFYPVMDSCDWICPFISKFQQNH